MSESKDLAISAEQDEFTRSQLAVLAHAGVKARHVKICKCSSTSANAPALTRSTVKST